MKKKIILLISMLLIISFISSAETRSVKNTVANLEYEHFNMKFLNDNTLFAPDINNKDRDIGLGPEPGYYDTSEYMIGNVAMGWIFVESDGSIDNSTEDWTPQEENNAKTQLGYGHVYWSNWFQNWYTGMHHNLMFWGETHKVNISYEPITHPTPMTDDTYEKLWVAEAMAKLGYTSGDWMQRVRDYNDYLRKNTMTIPGHYGTDWAFTVFVVDNSNDADSCFSDGYHAYSYLGGPFCVCPYLRAGGPPGPTLIEVFAHEIGHIFYATDEYNGNSERSGYLNAFDVEGSGCLMDNLAPYLSSGTELQVGWKDSDSDGIIDILDTNPETFLNAYTPDPTPNTVLTYTGSATCTPYPNNNPHGPGNDVTINTLDWGLAVDFRIDGGPWNPNFVYAIPDDGTWDEPSETYTITTPPLSVGTHTIEARSLNSVGNYDLTPASDTVTVTGGGNNPPSKPSKPNGPASGSTGTTYTYTTSTTDPDGHKVYYMWDWGDGTTSSWKGPFTSGQTASESKTWVIQGTYSIKVKAKDDPNGDGDLSDGSESPWSDPISVSMPRNKIKIAFFEKLSLKNPIFVKILRWFL